MKLKIKNGVIMTPNGFAVGAITDEAGDEVSNSIELGTELIESVQEFIDQVNSGTLRPRSAVKKFESLLDKYQL